MQPADSIHRLFQEAGLSTNPGAHERVFADVLQAQRQTMAERSAQPATWKAVMRHPVTKYAVAAVLIVAGLIGFSFFRSTGGITWAIEQSIEATGQCGAVLLEGSASECIWGPEEDPTPRPFRMWAAADANQSRFEKYRFVMDGITRLTTDGRKTWKYEPQAHRVTIWNYPYVAAQYWFGSSFLEKVKEARAQGILSQWRESFATDPATGERRIVLRVAWVNGRWRGPRSIQFEFDPESKLLVGMKQWENDHWENPASVVAERVTYYDRLPDTLFEFLIPPGATVVER